MSNNPPNLIDPRGTCFGLGDCGPIDDAGSLVTEAPGDVYDWGHTVYEHPASIAQQSAGTFVALTSTGDITRQNGVTFYEHCKGTCWFLNLIGADAITLGHDVFGRSVIGPCLAEHELTHVRQGDEYGIWWIPAYLWAQRHGTADNPFEQEAYAVQNQCRLNGSHLLQKE